MIEYKIWQYPRGNNPGGVLQTECIPAISTSNWQNNCFLIEIYEQQKTGEVPRA